MAPVNEYRTSREIPLIRLASFCRTLERALAARYAPADLPRLWRLFVSAECPECGIWISGDELHALTQPPCAEVASAKTGRMRLGDCARRGCNAAHYLVHLWNQEGIDWAELLLLADTFPSENAAAGRSGWKGWLPVLGRFKGYVVRGLALLAFVVLSLLARQFYQGGRIPFLREPEEFRVESFQPDPSWPVSRDSSE